MSRKLEIAANLSIVVAVLFFCVSTVKDRWFQPPTSSPSAAGPAFAAGTDGPQKGTQLHINGFKWEADKTLVLALSTQCHFCQESTPFYKELTSSPKTRDKRISIVTVFPQPASEAESFVKTNQIYPDKVLSMPLGQLGASVTPTVLLVDKTGKVQKLWLGMLSPSQQKELIAELTKA